jgi:AAA15 family ATPase/GTPase
MLIQFKTKNYKSFVEEVKFSMSRAAKQSGLDYSLLKENVKGKPVIGLCSSVVYGPNAAGKTNIIGAMDTFRTIVMRGNIRNSEEKSPFNPASSSLELIPNNKLNSTIPVDFSVTIFEEEMLIKYSVSLDLGLFLEEHHQRKIINEELYVNGNLIFKRGEVLELKNLGVIINYLSESFEKSFDNIYIIAQKSLNQEELFLTNGFKLIISQSFVKIITDWFVNKFMVICHADSIQLRNHFNTPQKKAIYVEKITDKAAKIFGVNSNAVGYAVDEDGSDAKLCSIFSKDDKNSIVAAEQFESYGTIRFLNIFPLIAHAISTGATFVVDEFDASIHPMALMNIINIFHNDNINIHHAQLIFNTHNPIFLNSNLFRRDEIKFVERDDTTHYSTLYSLSDFGTTGEKGVRKHEDYMKNYFINQYGAIKDIDFTPLFKSIVTGKDEV